eukprot:TRINITY_DN2716_c3_g1_i1.p9 TRINITY_DN2716_c3_g1~~TRINITY_DN2716_c3_g1_i1.p9  ORF type:complete len:105 (-),score=3.36 TRINITY_DN2716_c3_g1_i1:822-1136(-)
MRQEQGKVLLLQISTDYVCIRYHGFNSIDQIALVKLVTQSVPYLILYQTIWTQWGQENRLETSISEIDSRGGEGQGNVALPPPPPPTLTVISKYISILELGGEG